MKMNSLLKRYLSNSQGNILLIAAAAIPMLIAFTGLAIDGNRILKSSGHIQSAVDQAAIAAVAVDDPNRANLPPENSTCSARKLHSAFLKQA